MRPRASDQAIVRACVLRGMGVVDASCEGACACEQRVDARLASRAPRSRWCRIVLRLKPEVPGCCTLKLSISNATSSGGHKFKVLSLLLAQAVSNSWQPPGTKVTAAWTMDSMGEYNATDDENEKKFISSERREERKANARKKAEEKKAKRGGKGDGAKKLGKADGLNPTAKRGGEELKVAKWRVQS